MKDRRLQTKRQSKTGFRAVFAKTAARKQRASAAATDADFDEMDGDIPQVGIGKSLTVILVLHIVAIIAIYVGTKWQGSEPAENNAVVAYDEKNKEDSSQPNADNKHKFRVGQPSSYQKFERSSEVSHQLPTTPDRGVSEAGVAAEQVVTSDQASSITRKPRLITPKRNPNIVVPQASTSQLASKSYTVASGDTIYRIALRNNVKQQEILDLNNIANANKIHPGMVIQIPVK